MVRITRSESGFTWFQLSPLQRQNDNRDDRGIRDQALQVHLLEIFGCHQTLLTIKQWLLSLRGAVQQDQTFRTFPLSLWMQIPIITMDFLPCKALNTTTWGHDHPAEMGLGNFGCKSTWVSCATLHGHRSCP